MGRDTQEFTNYKHRETPGGGSLGQILQDGQCRTMFRKFLAMRVDQDIRVKCNQFWDSMKS